LFLALKRLLVLKKMTVVTAQANKSSNNKKSIRRIIKETIDTLIAMKAIIMKRRKSLRVLEL